MVIFPQAASCWVHQTFFDCTCVLSCHWKCIGVYCRLKQKGMCKTATNGMRRFPSLILVISDTLHHPFPFRQEKERWNPLFAKSQNKTACRSVTNAKNCQSKFIYNSKQGFSTEVFLLSLEFWLVLSVCSLAGLGCIAINLLMVVYGQANTDAKLHP